MRHPLPTLTCLILLGAATASADEAALRRDVEYLASDALEGRLTGTPGARAAAAHLAAELEALGALPLPGHDGFELHLLWIIFYHKYLLIHDRGCV
jgi:hypothetical protein